MNDTEALKLARDAFTASTTYVDANFRKQWQDALRMFQSRHPSDSKYNSEAYRYRSRLFRPKTRSVIRKTEAAIAAAFFANVDVVNLSAANEKDPKQVTGSKFYKELLQHRLTKTIPWFLTLIGGAQDALTVGVVCSYQHWKYREATTGTRNFSVNEDTGAPIMGFDGGPIAYDQQASRVIEDEPAIDLIPVEELRIDKGASWTNPVKTSPYLIHTIPMYLGDVKMMGEPNRKTGEPGWIVPADSVLLAATKQTYDPTRQTREGNREDSKDSSGSANPTDFDIVWVHKNIMRRNGEDFCYYSLGVEHLLSKPKPLSEIYFHGERPYVMGCAVIETHKIYPGGYPELGKEVQKEINETVNQRQDNVKLALNKRFKVKRGAQVDVRSLVRNVAGSVTMVNHMEDVDTIDFNDVTASSYAEQDRLNVDFDELLGNFSSSSVQTNRKLNETVGGMALISQGANQMTEFSIRTLTETWIEPVLRQMVKLEKYYETDETVIKLVGQKMGTEITDEMFDTDVELNVNVGMGATDPTMRVNRLLTGAKAFADIAAMQAPGLQLVELGKEIFSILGYRDGGRFYSDEQDPRVVKLQGMVQALQDALGQAKQLLEQRDEVDQIKLQEMAITLQNASDKVAAEIDNLEADTAKKLAEAKLAANPELRARATSATAANA